MNVAKAIKKGNKITGTEVQVNSNGLHFWHYKGEVVAFYPNGRNTPESTITCIQSHKIGDKSDSMTDYCAATFHDNLTQAFRFVDSYTAGRFNKAA